MLHYLGNDLSIQMRACTAGEVRFHPVHLMPVAADRNNAMMFVEDQGYSPAMFSRVIHRAFSAATNPGRRLAQEPPNSQDRWVYGPGRWRGE